MGAADTRAGRAYVELLLKDSDFVKGLNRIGGNLKSLGKGVATIGATFTAAGGVIKGALLGALHHFASAGSVLNDMSIRTGIAGAKLAELGYAAEQSGAGLEDVETGVRKMQKFLNAATQATSEEAKALRDLGLSVAQIKSMSPDQQFEAIAAKIAAIEDPTRRAAMAMKVFGKGGTSLLPMIADLRALQDEFRALDIAPSEEDIRKADAVGDAFDRIKSIVRQVSFNVGAALADSFLKIADTVTTVATTVNKWVRENRALFATLSAIGTGLIVVGGGITAVGLGIGVIGSAMTGIVTGLGAIATVIATVTSPLGIMAAALAGGVYLWTQYTTSGQNAVSTIKSLVGDLAATFKETFGGISDAISGGDLALAGQIGMAGLKLAFLQGWQAITAMFGPEIDKVTDVFYSAWGAVSEWWNAWGDSIIGAFKAAADSVLKIWNYVSSEVSKRLIELSGQFDELQKKQDTMDAKERTILQTKLDEKHQQLTDAKASSSGAITTAAGEQMSVDDLERSIKDLEKSLGYFSKPRDVRDEAKKGIDKSFEQQPAREPIGAPKRGSRSNNAANDAADAAQKQLDDLRKQAAELRAKKDAEQQGKAGQASGAAAGMEGGATGAVASTFSAAAAVALGQGGGGPMDRMANGIDKAVSYLSDQVGKTEQMARALEKSLGFTT